MSGEPAGSTNVRLRPTGADDAGAIAAIHIRTWQFADKNLLPDEALSGLEIADRFRLWQRLLNE